MEKKDKKLRIGSLPISYKGAKVLIEKSFVKFEGPLGQNIISVPFWLQIEDNKEKQCISIKPEYIGKNKDRLKMWGTLNRLMNNAVLGVMKKFEAHLKLSGLGYKCQKKDNELKLDLGYSNSIFLTIPSYIQVDVKQEVNVVVSGIDKQKVGEFANILTKLRKYNVYSQKGILWTNNKSRVYITKPTKTKG